MSLTDHQRSLRVGIAEPDLPTSRLLHFVFTDAGYEVVVTSSAPEAMRAALDGGVDALLVETDAWEPAGGYNLCKTLRGRGYNGPLIFTSQRITTPDKLRGFDCGADDFVTKPFDPQELIARIESAARRFRCSDHQALGRILKVGDAELSIGDLTFHREGQRKLILTPTEMRLLECLMRNSSITISRETLIDRVWPDDYMADANRVDVFIGRLRKKIETDPGSPEYIHTVRGVGYAFRPARVSRVLDLPVLGNFQPAETALPAAQPN